MNNDIKLLLEINLGIDGIKREGYYMHINEDMGRQPHGPRIKLYYDNEHIGTVSVLRNPTGDVKFDRVKIEKELKAPKEVKDYVIGFSVYARNEILNYSLNPGDRERSLLIQKKAMYSDQISRNMKARIIADKEWEIRNEK